jgi:hypothetical protein
MEVTAGGSAKEIECSKHVEGNSWTTPLSLIHSLSRTSAIQAKVRVEQEQ